MVIAAIFQAVAEVCIGPDFRGKRVAVAENFNVEVVVRRRCQIGEFLIGIRPFRNDPEIELANIKFFCFRKARYTHCDVVAAHISEG